MSTPKATCSVMQGLTLNNGVTRMPDWNLCISWTCPYRPNWNLVALRIKTELILTIMYFREQARGRLGRNSLPTGSNFSLFSVKGEVLMYRTYMQKCYDFKLSTTKTTVIWCFIAFIPVFESIYVHYWFWGWTVYGASDLARRMVRHIVSCL